MTIIIIKKNNNINSNNNNNNDNNNNNSNNKLIKLGFIAPKSLNYVAFHSVHFERT